MVDLGDFLEVTHAITGKRVLVNKMAVATITEGSDKTHIRFDKDFMLVAKESYDDIVECFETEEVDE